MVSCPVLKRPSIWLNSCKKAWRVWTINMGCWGGSRPMIKTFFPFPLQARTFLGTLSGTDAQWSRCATGPPFWKRIHRKLCSQSLCENPEIKSWARLWGGTSKPVEGSHKAREWMPIPRYPKLKLGNPCQDQLHGWLSSGNPSGFRMSLGEIQLSRCSHLWVPGGRFGTHPRAKRRGADDSTVSNMYLYAYMLCIYIYLHMYMYQYYCRLIYIYNYIYILYYVMSCSVLLRSVLLCNAT